jgi:hypothetical protein
MAPESRKMDDEVVGLDSYATIYEDEDYLITYEPSTDEAKPGDTIPICYVVDSDAETSEDTASWILIDPAKEENSAHWFELLHRLAQAVGDKGMFLGDVRSE